MLYSDDMAEEFIDRLNKIIDDRIGPLEYSILDMQRAMVDLRAYLISQKICTDSQIRYLTNCIHLRPEDMKIQLQELIRKHDIIVNELNNAFSFLRGKLTEEAIPEDAYRYWLEDVRKRLLGTGILTSQEVNQLISTSLVWETIIGFHSLE